MSAEADAPNVADIDAKAPENAAGGQSDAPRDYEAEAREQGWTPQADYRGKRPWVDAETFVKKGEELAPFLQANNKALERALKDRDAELKSIRKTLEALGEHHSKTSEREYKRALADLTARQEAAAEIGDVAGVKAATESIRDLDKEARAETPKPAADKPEADVTPEQFAAWEAENPWYKTDTALRGACREMAQEVFEETGLRGVAQMAEVTKRIKAEFPNKFANPRRTQPGAVEGGGSPPRSGGKTYSDLPPAAKAMCDDFVKNIKGFTREKYVKEFDWT